jgi:cell division protease FtsH
VGPEDRAEDPLARRVGVRSIMKQMAQAAAVASAVSMATPASAADPWPYSTLLAKVQADEVAKVAFSDTGDKAVAFDQEGRDHQVQLIPGGDAELIKELQKHNVQFAVVPPPTAGPVGNFLGSAAGVLFNFLPLFLLIGINILANRGMGGGGGMGGPGGPMGLGKSQSKIELEPNTGVTFDDVAGADGAKLELQEIVNFLKEPAKYSALGAKIPKGAVMEGPPGTGKTLLARAVAGEAGVPFVSASGSEFVEMFVGVGASRVRDLFGQAKKNAPCIVFIDEIDAIGGQRGGNNGGGNDEREQTLNQILTEMDGFDGNSGVIVLAATNRADMLDAALVRPGRFDRRVSVDLPDVKGRLAIIKVHVRGKPISNQVDLSIIAKRTTGFSGASLANLMNEAAIVAARKSKTEIEYEDIDYAIDRQQVGMQKNTGMKFPNRQKLVAYHEAGHAVAGLMLPEYDMVTKVTIVPRTNGAGGFTLFTPSEERMETGMYTKKYLKNQLVVALGGRMAEELVYGEKEVTTGASNDLQQVRSIARRMVAQWGFANAEMGNAPVAWELEQGNGINAGMVVASPTTEKEIDKQVENLVKEAYDRCYALLTKHRALMDEMTERLIAEETIDYTDLEKMRDQHLKTLEAVSASSAAA